MISLLKRMRQHLCRHPNRRVFDVRRTAEDAYLVRLYCPDCGRREDVARNAGDIIEHAAGGNAEMRETMKRNMEDSDEC